MEDLPDVQKYTSNVVDSLRASVGGALAAGPCRILDVGCGTGLLLRSLCAAYPTIEVAVGVDPAERMIEQTTKRAAAAGKQDVRNLNSHGVKKKMMIEKE